MRWKSIYDILLFKRRRVRYANRGSAFTVILMNVRDELFRLQDAEYKAFHAALVPTVAPERMIGVRVPKLRKLAKYLAGTEDEFEPYYYEEYMLAGMRIGYRKCTAEEYLRQLSAFVPLIDNWAVCDCCCSTYKFAARYPEPTWQFIQPYLQGAEYEARFAIVMMMDYFLTDAYIDQVLRILSGIQREEYYVNMAAAWALSVAYVRYPQKVLPILQSGRLSDGIHNRTIQKIRESNRVTKDAKQDLLQYKR